ncbi:SMI1/KNR4 family protein [Streptomyces sp. NPDC005963]|uniref:SMI1/KNR4 family protein n=1 Tax=Streptomyces sp. NPDC005963 TaxID=3156721 RepID=UPI0033DA27A2
MSRDLLQQLMDLMPPHEGAGDVVDWGLAEAEYGTAFPRDYRGFVEQYGAGTISEDVTVSIPRPRGARAEPLTLQRLPEDTISAPSMQGWQDPAQRASYRLEDMLLWGQAAGADALCWVTTGDSPDDWPIAVWKRQSEGWAVYECGIVEFLLRVLRAEFDRCPLSDRSVWGDPTPRFLNFREEERLVEAGIDPWTGDRLPDFT